MTGYTFFVVLCFAASMVSGVFGFGSAMIVLAIGPHFLPVAESIALAAVLFLASTLTKAFLFRKHLDWKVVGTMAMASVPFAYAGALILPSLDPGIARRLLGLMILAYLGVKRFPLPRVRLGTAGLISGSALYGFLSGLVGSGSVIKVVMLRELNITREAFVGAMAATSVLSGIAKVTAYSQAGLLNSKLLWPIVGVIVAAVSSAFVGRSFLREVSVRQFDVGVQILLAVAALALLW